MQEQTNNQAYSAFAFKYISIFSTHRLLIYNQGYYFTLLLTIAYSLNYNKHFKND